MGDIFPWLRLTFRFVGRLGFQSSFHPLDQMVTTLHRVNPTIKIKDVQKNEECGQRPETKQHAGGRSRKGAKESWFVWLL